jgi:hypothetical protein
VATAPEIVTSKVCQFMKAPEGLFTNERERRE